MAAKDLDPDGAELASTSNPLEEAAKLLVPLREHASGKLKTHTLIFEVAFSSRSYIRFGCNLLLRLYLRSTLTRGNASLLYIFLL